MDKPKRQRVEMEDLDLVSFWLTWRTLSWKCMNGSATAPRKLSTEAPTGRPFVQTEFRKYWAFIKSKIFKATLWCCTKLKSTLAS